MDTCATSFEFAHLNRLAGRYVMPSSANPGKTRTNPKIRDVVLTQRFYPEHGGSIRWLYEVYRRWPTPVRVLTHKYPRTLGNHPIAPPLRVVRRKIQMHDWGLFSTGSTRAYLRMIALLRRATAHAGITRIHCAHAVPEATAALAMRWLRPNHVKLIAYAHGEEILACMSSRQLTHLLRWTYRFTDCIIANSVSTANLVRPLLSTKHQHKVSVISPGTSLADFDAAVAKGNALRKRLGWEDHVIILSLGRLVPRKNHAMVLRAFARVADRHTNTRLIIAGNGPELNRLQKLAADLGIDDRTRFFTNVTDSQRIALFGAMDVFIMPAVQTETDLEGYGIVFIEAAACGKPSIGGNTGGQPEAIVDGVTGFHVDGHRLEEVTQALEKLTADPSLRARLGYAGKQFARNKDWSAVMRQTFALVRTLDM